MCSVHFFATSFLKRNRLLRGKPTAPAFFQTAGRRSDGEAIRAFHAATVTFNMRVTKAHFDQTSYPTFENFALRKTSPSRKRRRGSIIAFEMLRLDRNSREPLHQQLYRHIRDELISGSFDHDSARLPSSSALADDLGIARLTVKLAFEKLHSEGYLKSKIGSGTFVADSLPETFLSPDNRVQAHRNNALPAFPTG